MTWFILLLLVVSWFPRAQEPHEIHTRQMAGVTMLLLWMAATFPNTYLGLLLALGALGVWWAPIPINSHRLIILPGLPWIVSYYVGAWSVTPEWIVPVLSCCVGIGLVQAIWMSYSVFIGGRYYRHRFKLFDVYEDHWSGLTAGATNTNLTDAISGVTAASAIGLVWCASPWWILGAIACAMPILVNQGMILDRDLTPTQGSILLATFPCAAVLILGGWLGWSSIGLLAVGVFGMGWKYRGSMKIWSLRDVIWIWAWQVWTHLPFAGKLFGAGTGSWIPMYSKHGPTMPQHLATHPHNEYVHVFFEQGVVGIVALACYLSMGLWTASHGTPAMQAVAFVGWVLCAAAFLQWPWTQFHEVAFQSRPDPNQPMVEQLVNGHGIPTLNALTLAVAVLLEAR